ncbi:MAG: hypothetical protein JZD41_01525 [Thermoproteus sp.]|nr:hypothetical protein [Thermoproteus sp.]
MKGVETIYMAFLMGVAVIAGMGFIVVWSNLSSSWAAKQQFAGWASGYRPVFIGDQMVLPDGVYKAPNSTPTLIGYCLAYRAEGGVVYSCPGVMPNMTFSSQSSTTTIATTSRPSTSGVSCTMQKMSDGSVIYSCHCGS